MNKLKDLSLSFKGIQRYSKELKNTQYFSEAQIQEYQFKKIKILLIISYEKIEYYKRLFKSIQFNPYHDFNCLNDLEKIPILTKEMAFNNHSLLLNPDYLKKGIELRTSGSTGKIFKEFVSENHWIVEQGIVWRHWSWCNYKFRNKMAIIRSFVPKEGESLWRLDKIRNFKYFSAYHLNIETAKIYLKELKKWNPQILRGYPSSLYILAKMAEKLNINIEPPKAILTASEMLLPHYRMTIEKIFQAKIYDWYGQAECTVTFNECEKHEGMHINSEYGYLELLKSYNLNINERMIIATNINNYAMPLIRYETGDIAILSGNNKCSCGRQLPIIHSFKGRSDDFLYTQDGRIIPSVNLYTLMDGFNDIIEFQFIQNKINEIIINISSNGFSNDSKVKLLNGLQERFGKFMEYKINVTNDFVRTTEGKKRVIVSNLSDKEKVIC